MIAVDKLAHNDLSEKLVAVQAERTKNTNLPFFRVMVGYYFAMTASMQRCGIKLPNGAVMPINMFSVALGPSGCGKTSTVNMMEDEVLHLFRQKFTDETFPVLAEQNFPKLANKRAGRKGTDPDDELESLRVEFENQGELAFSFDQATVPAVKQARHKLLMASAGSINMQIDELGNNLLGAGDVLSTMVELFDIGKTKNKLVKNTAENLRTEEIQGRTPANVLLFGTPNRVLDGSKVEDAYRGMLDDGYARRAFFAYINRHVSINNKTAAEVLKEQLAGVNEKELASLATKFARLADPAHVNKVLSMSNAVSLAYIEYKHACEREAALLPEHEDIRSIELMHRHAKVLKLAGAYAFMEGATSLELAHLEAAMLVAHESGENFKHMMTRDRAYVKLAKYIASCGRSLTQPDLVEDLPFYKGSAAQKSDMMNLAIAHGYQNNILIKKAVRGGIDFVSGETLEATDLLKMTVSYSQDLAHGYANETCEFEQLHLLTSAIGHHWTNHHFQDGHRHDEKAIPGFNMIVLDVDHGINLSTAMMLMKDYKALFYVTKRHTDTEQRFRIVLPTNYQLKLDRDTYKEFMTNLFEWLPFEVDEATGQRARKWLSHNGHYAYQEGKLFDVLPFIPETTKNEQRQNMLTDQASMDNLERWVINNSAEGNRSNQLMRYAYVLVDAGFDYDGIRQKVNSLNEKMPNKLEEVEILSTIMVTVAKAIAKR